MVPAESDDEQRRTRGGKVARVIHQYDLEGFGVELERAWTAEGEDRRSLRALADDLNRELLRASIRRADGDSLETELDALYQGLADEGVSSADRTRIRRRLERRGVDVDQLESDFVSYQAVRTYLTKHRDATYEKPETDRLGETKTTIERLRSKTETVSANRLERLERADELAVGDLTVTVDVRATCRECGAQYTVTELLEERGCECS
ncbi:rod-determining factor RdfA [Natronorubrum daqingense]|uniref:Uncharacterized protein n=1 Tax=Natronorubrum daqingense TaxID=588898 RepID=A0A1N7EUP0_9EURY|nr:rod-determining factor RdfA [Natronorubrum daqingense]APX97706.1 hypothetical protein BB347_14385 [Natronorubrum daqingense]SIR91767.1 hypothetical protein SAMN05421809_2876 [Natronorubrum daqingense]